MNIPKEFEPYFPTNCPHCNNTLILDDVHLLCENEDCTGIKKALFHYGVELLNLFGVGTSIIDDIYKSGFDSPFDLLNPIKFNKDVLIERGIMHDGKTIDNLFTELENVNEITLQKIILMLGYQGIGNSTAIQIANFVANVPYDFTGLQKSTIDGFEPGNHKRIKLDNTIDMLQQCVNIIMPVDLNIDDNIKVELTGSPKSAGFSSKGEFLAFVKQHKVIQYGLKHDTDYLIVDSYQSNSSKTKKAEKNKIKIVTYLDFLSNILKINQTTND